MSFRSEAAYQLRLTRKIKEIFPDSYILKNDPHTNQGVPDLLVLIGSHWFMLEVKVSMSSPRQPNQEHYIRMFDGMSFAAFICPENEEQVFDDIQSTFGVSR